MDDVRIRYWTETKDGGEWMLSGLMERKVAEQIVDSGAYRDAYIVEEE